MGLQGGMVSLRCCKRRAALANGITPDLLLAITAHTRSTMVLLVDVFRSTCNSSQSQKKGQDGGMEKSKEESAPMTS